MKSDIIIIDNQGNGFRDALTQTVKAAQYRELTHKETLRLRLCTEEMLSLARSVTGELRAEFWLESEGKRFNLHLTTRTLMDREKREKLIAASTSRQNESASSFLGMLRDVFEAAMVADPEPEEGIPDEVLNDLVNHPIEAPEWDEYEQSILRRAADNVKIGIRGGIVDMTVSTHFE